MFIWLATEKEEPTLHPIPYYELCEKLIWLFIIYKVKDYETKS